MPPHKARLTHHRLARPTSKSAYTRDQVSARGTRCFRELGAGGSNSLTPTSRFNRLADEKLVRRGSFEPPGAGLRHGGCARCPPKAEAGRSNRLGSASSFKESDGFLHRPLRGEVQLCAERCRNCPNLTGRFGAAKSGFVPYRDSGAVSDEGHLTAATSRHGTTDRVGVAPAILFSIFRNSVAVTMRGTWRTAAATAGQRSFPAKEGAIT